MTIKISELEELISPAADDLLAVYDVDSANDYATEKMLVSELANGAGNPLNPVDPNYTNSVEASINHYLQEIFESLLLVAYGGNVNIFLPNSPTIGSTYAFTLLNDSSSSSNTVSIIRQGTGALYYKGSSGVTSVNITNSGVGYTYLCACVSTNVWLVLQLGQN